MKNYFLSFPAVFICFLLSACNGSRTFSDIKGVWGGEHIEINISDSLAIIEYDCAHGTMKKLIFFKDDGNFEALGIHTLESGKVKFDDVPKPINVIFRGNVKDEKMTLQLFNSDSDKQIGSFELQHGMKGKINKCE